MTTPSLPQATLKHHFNDCQNAYAEMAAWIDGRIRANKRPTMLVGPMQGALLVLTEVVRRTKEKKTYRMVDVVLYDADNKVGEAATFTHWPISEEDLGIYDFIVVDDVAESLRTYAAIRQRLAARKASVELTTLVDKPVEKRVTGIHPSFAPLKATEDEWLVGEGMNDGDSVEGQQWRCMPGIWVKQT